MAVLCLVPAEIQAGDFRAAQGSSKADEQHRPIAQAAQGIPVERLEHGDQVFRQDRFLLARRGGMFVANAGHDGGDGAIPAIEFLRAALGIVPADGGKTPLDGRNAVQLAAACWRANGTAGGAGGDVEADDLRIRGQGRKILAATPGGKMLPVGGVGLSGVGGTGRRDIAAGALGEILQLGGQPGVRLGKRGGEVWPKPRQRKHQRNPLCFAVAQNAPEGEFRRSRR